MKKILQTTMMACALMLASNLAWSQVQQPFHGVPFTLPGTIEAEDFDHGGQGVAYYDVKTLNIGGKYRTDESVDIEECSEGGFNIFKIETYEWLEYTVEVTESANYSFGFRVASTNNGGKIDMSLDGNSIGSLRVPNTGGMQTWRTINQTFGSVSTPLSPGVYVLRLSFSNTETHYDMFNVDKIFVTSKVKKPFYGSPITLPGTIEAEDFDHGGQGVGYLDVKTLNLGGKYRNGESVDIEECSEGGYNIFKIETYEWLEYTVNVSDSARYSFEFRVASTTTGGRITTSVDGDTLGTINVPNTGGMQTWTTVKQSFGGWGIPLTPGVHVLRFAFSHTEVHYDMFNLDKIIVTDNIQRPFSGTPIALPGTFEAEDFDHGGPSVAYHDATSVNEGGQYRIGEFVDIQASSDGGHNVFRIQPYEFLNYTVNVLESGNYNFQFKLASDKSAGRINISLDQNFLGFANIPNTGGMQTWSTVTESFGGTGVYLSAGVHELRIGFTTKDGLYHSNLLNLDNVTVINSNGCTGSYNSDYSYVVSNDSSNPTITFNPITPGVGSGLVILYYGTGSGTYPGYFVTPGVPFQINAANGSNINFYYTYTVPTGGERTSLDTPHNFTVGNCGSSARKADISSSFDALKAVYPNPMGDSDLLYFAETDKNVSVKIYNASGIVVLEQNSWSTGKPLDLSSLKDGIFNVFTYDGNEMKSYKVVR